MLSRKGRGKPKNTGGKGDLTRLQTARMMRHDTMDDGTNDSASGSPSKDNNEPVTLTMDRRCGASPLASAFVPSSGENL